MADATGLADTAAAVPGTPTVPPSPPSPPPEPRFRALAPLSDRTFRTIWSASLLSNFGQLVLGVGAAWEMTRLAGSEMVALVQTALMLPLMLVAVPAGAVADMFDRRKIAMTGLAFSSICGVILTTLATLGLAGPWVLLAFCSLIGAGVALYSPSWQASIGEQVPAEHLPAAVSLGAVSYNIARSFGPALGGVIVAAFGAKAAFGLNAVFYLPLLLAFLFWRRRQSPPRLPPEKLHRAIVSGLRYAVHAPTVRIVMIRSFLLGAGNAAVTALTPLIAKTMLGGGPATYGLLLGATGVGAVIGALLVSDVRERFGAEAGLRFGMGAIGLMVIVVAFSHSLPLTAAALAIAGGGSMLTSSMLNVAVQLSVPRWVTARALAWYSSAMTGGVAVGAVIWGRVTADHGLTTALLASALSILLLPLLGLVMPLRETASSGIEALELGDEPEVALGIGQRSGPIIVELDYRVDPGDARAFYEQMQNLQGVRQRNGGFEWSLARDLGDPWLWTERFHFPTWGDYLRQRTRYTQADRDTQLAAETFNQLREPSRIRRRLERPMGSVRWHADTPDHRTETIGVFTPGA